MLDQILNSGVLRAFDNDEHGNITYQTLKIPVFPNPEWDKGLRVSSKGKSLTFSDTAKRVSITTERDVIVDGINFGRRFDLGLGFTAVLTPSKNNAVGRLALRRLQLQNLEAEVAAEVAVAEAA
jgi:hypothetical protein